MKVLVAGDLHFMKSQFQWIESQKHTYDCLCLTGDLLDLRLNGFEEQTKWVTNWIKTFDKQIFICSGNHDLDDFGECEWLNSIKNSKLSTDNQIRVFKGIKFGCIPYLGGNLSDFYDCDILLTHVPPYKTATSIVIEGKDHRDLGDQEIYDALSEGIIKPRYIFCGHVENPVAKKDHIFGVDVVNPGSERNDPIPNHEIITIHP